MGHHHHDHATPKNYNFAFFISITLNLVYTILQVIFAYLANSSSLLADAGHNLSDVLSLIFAWFGEVMHKKKSSTRFSYGLKKTTVLTALLNALILFTASGLIAAEAISKFFHPRPVRALDIIIVAAIGILVNIGTALFFTRDRKKDLNIKAAFLHLAYDALVSAGVVVGGIIIYFTGWEILDPIVSLIITVVIIVGTWSLLKNALFLAIDAVPAHIDLKDVETYLQSIPGVDAVHDLHIWPLSTKHTALSAHLIMPKGQYSDEERHHIDLALKEKFQITHTTIQVESLPEKDNPCLQQDDCV